MDSEFTDYRVHLRVELDFVAKGDEDAETFANRFANAIEGLEVDGVSSTVNDHFLKFQRTSARKDDPCTHESLSTAGTCTTCGLYVPGKHARR